MDEIEVMLSAAAVRTLGDTPELGQVKTPVSTARENLSSSDHVQSLCDAGELTRNGNEAINDLSATDCDVGDLHDLLIAAQETPDGDEAERVDQQRKRGPNAHLPVNHDDTVDIQPTDGDAKHVSPER